VQLHRSLTCISEEVLRPNVLHLTMTESEKAKNHFSSLFAKYRLLHFRNVAHTSSQPAQRYTWRDIGPLFNQLNSKDKESWCVETQGESASIPDQFLRPEIFDDRSYCSFLVQHTESAYDEATKSFPLTSLSWLNATYEHALWIFFGRNSSQLPSDLTGRPEHTDSVLHDGTWHYQLSGRKKWILKPTEDLLKKMGVNSYFQSPQSGIFVECNEGDVLVIEYVVCADLDSYPFVSNSICFS
jgi:hypothetical protein